MSGVQRTIAIIVVWVVSLGALTVLYGVSNLIWLPDWAVLLSSALFLTAAAAATHFITHSAAPTT